MKVYSSFFFSFIFLLLACSLPKADKNKQISIKPLTQSISASFRGIASYGAKQVWLGGTSGTVLHSSNGGSDWEKLNLPNADSLDFRDIEVLGARTALLMSIGPGTDSRIYKTTDSGENWTMTFQNTEAKAFFDGIDFWNNKTGMMISDPIDERLLLLKTTDAGASWQRVGESSLPKLLPQEYGFAASGTGIVTLDEQKVWVATGGDAARVFVSADGGASWEVVKSPVMAGKNSAGIFSIAFRDALNGVAVGGDYLNPNVDEGNIARTSDGGKTWQLVKNNPPIFHKACVQHLDGSAYLATGRTGSALTRDDGKTWEIIDATSYYCLTFDAASGVGYLAGAEGRVAKFTWN